jgi:hypothetical protein
MIVPPVYGVVSLNQVVFAIFAFVIHLSSFFGGNYAKQKREQGGTCSRFLRL